MMRIKNYKKLFVFITLLLIIISLIFLGSSYAIFIKTSESKNNQIVKSGDLQIKYESGNEIYIDKDENNNSLIVPMIDEEGLKTAEYVFSITNVGTLPANYRVNINNGNENNLVEWSYIRYSLDNNKPDFLSNVSDNLLFANSIMPGQTKTFSLRIWIWLEYNSETQDYIGAPNDIKGKQIHLTIDVEGTVQKCEKASLSEKTSLITKNMEKYCINNKVLYYYGNYYSNNYILFADRLWRIISVNTDGSIRVISNDVLFNSIYSSTNDLTQIFNFEESMIKRNLDNYYIENIKQFESNLSLSNYCIDGANSYNDYYNNNRNLNCKNTYESYYGLLSIKEYALFNKETFKLDKPYWIYNINDDYTYSIINEHGNYDTLLNNNSSGVRMVININDGLINNGDGSIDNPYII